MNKWKQRSRRILVFLLILGFAGTMMDHSQLNAAAADAVTEKEASKADSAAAAEEPAGSGDQTAEEAEKPEEAGETKENVEPEEPKETEEPEQTEESKEKEEPKDTEESEEKEEPKEDGGSAGNEEPEPGSDEIQAEEQEKNGTLAAEDSAKTEEETTKLQEDADVTAVRELLEGLPLPEELNTLDQEQKAEVLEKLEAVIEAYEKLSEEQKALLPGADAQLKELMDYLTEPAVPLAATDQQMKAAWDAMTGAMENWASEVDLSSYNLTASDWGRIWPDVVRNNPDLFYVFDCKYFTENGIITKCQLFYNSVYNQNSVTEYRNAINRVFAEVIDKNGTMTDVQKATALHDYLVQHMVYDQNANNNLGIEKRNAYEALVNGIGVCEGYTLAYAALLKKAGIEVGYCRSKSMNHIWNYVQLDGNWYHADLTFDDATAASQVGETGYVKHEYFLLSDTAMKNASHNWEPNGITCTDTSYDNSWHKTAPLKESAIYTVGGNSYYLKSEIVDGAPNTIIRGAALMKRDSSGNVTTVKSFDIKNLGNGAGNWPMYNICFSRLSCSQGVLYFNVGNSIYAYKPSAYTEPVEIYQYTDANNRIVTGLLSDGNEMTLEIYNPQSKQIEEKIEVSVFTLRASETKVKVGYTTAPVLTANPQATGFTWSKQLNGSWETINGAAGSSYTIETGLPKGSYRYRVSATLNGKAVSDEIVIIVTDQEEQKNFSFSEKSKTVTYGDNPFMLTAQGAETGSAVRYSSSNPSVASIEPASGRVTIHKAGSAVITAIASETEKYLEARSTCRLTVSPKALTWDVSALKAGDRLDLIKGSTATLFGELKLAGILEKDKGTVRFECKADKLAAVYETVAAGSQKVKLSWKDTQNPAVLQGDGIGNYTIPANLPEIQGNIRLEDGTAYKTEVENGISKVPETFKNKEHLNTPSKIIKEIKQKLQEKFKEIPAANIAVYDVELLVNVNGFGWEKATKENFPSQGLTITLPYPSGTGKNSHNFAVTHMFTEDMNGFCAGDVEHPAVTKTDNGLTFTVHGLSPIAIGWEEAGSGSSGGTNSSKSESSAVKVKSPRTGNTSPILLYLLLTLASTTTAAWLYYKTKKFKL